MVKRTSRDPASLLPDKKSAPRKSGKKGIGALDVEKDFETPTKKEPEAKTEAAKPVGSLLVKQPEKPKVVGDRMEVFYLKPIINKTPKGDITISLVVTVPLEDAHKSILPKIIQDGYHDMKKKGRTGMNFKDVPGQRAEFYVSSDAKEETLVLPAAKVTNASLALVQRKGEGQARDVVRLSFRLQVKLSREVANFAEHNLQNNFWLSLAETQEELFDEDAGEE